MAPEAPIALSTFDLLGRHGHKWTCTDGAAERWVTIDLAAFPPEMPYIGRQFRRRYGGRCWPTISMAKLGHLGGAAE